MGKPIVIAAEVDPRGVATGVGQATGHLGRLGGTARRVGTVVATALVGVGVAAVAVTGAASEAQQSIGATESVYGKYADTVVAKSNEAASAVGLSANAYRETSNVLGAMLKNAGTPLDKLAAKTDKLVGLGGDLAATYGGTTTEAVEALSSLLRGEADPIERYGVSIKQSDVNARLAAQGLGKLTGEALKQAEAQARLDLLYKQTGAAQGQFARESETFAGQQQRMTASVQNISASLGTALLPALTEVGKVINTSVLPPIQAFADEHGPELGRQLGQIVVKAGPLANGLLDKISSGIAGLNEGSAGDNLSSIGDSFSRLAPLVGQAVSALPSFADVLDVTATVMEFAADNTDLLAKALPFLVAGYVGVKAAGVAANIAQVAALPTKIAEVIVNRQLVASNRALIASRVGLTGATVANTTAENVGTASRSRSLVGLVAQRTAMVAGAAVTGVMTAAQWALNVALTANPIGLLVVGLAALTAGLVIAYKKSETFRNIVNGAFSVVGAAVRLYLTPVTVGLRLIGSAAGAMGRAVVTAGGKAVGAVRDLRGKVLGAVAGFPVLLFNAGSKLIGGLIKGILSKVPGVGSAVGVVAGAIKKYFPGSPVKEGPLTSWNDGGAGKRLIDQGLIAGINARRGAVAGAIGRVASTSNVTFDAKGKASTMPTLPLGNGQTVIHQTINITVEVDSSMTEAQVGAKILRAIRAAVSQGLVVGDVKVVTT